MNIDEEKQVNEEISKNEQELYENEEKELQEEKTEIFVEGNSVVEETPEKKDIIEKVRKKIIISKEQKMVFHMIAIICIALLAIANAPKTLQNDTYYTITIGEYIYNNGISDLTQDIYSIHDLPYTYPHWLYDLGLFLVYNKFGHQGIYVSTMILSAILGLSIYGLCNKKSKNELISLIITIGSIYLIKEYIAARAQLVTFILFIWTVFAIEKFLETHKFRYVFLLILIPLLITNLHCAVFPFYFILYLPYIAEYFITAFVDCNFGLKIIRKVLILLEKVLKDKEKKLYITKRITKVNTDILEKNKKIKTKRENPYKIKVEKNKVVLFLIVIMLVAALTGFINPAGDGAYTYLYKTLKGNTTDSINEHLPLTLVENKEFFVAVLICLLILIFSDTKIRLSDLFMLAGITFLAFNSRRQVSMFAILCGPIIAKLIADMMLNYNLQILKIIERLILTWLGTVAVLSIAIIGSANIIKPTLLKNYVNQNKYPVDASEWILANLDINNIRLYNQYNFGSYLLHKGIPVFIDSRCDLYTPEFNGEYVPAAKVYNGRDIFSDALNIASLKKSYKVAFKEYNITHVILLSDAKLATVLEGDEDYKRLYSDGSFKIFERLTNTVDNK